MPGERVPGTRKDLDAETNPTLNEGEYGLLGGFWWACPPGGHATPIEGVTVHEDGTISVEFKHLGEECRIDHGVWKPPAPN